MENARKQFDYLLPFNSILHDRYRIIDCLGIGGFGIVYLCEDLVRHECLAMKELFPAQWVEREDTYVSVQKSTYRKACQSCRRAFYRESQILATLDGQKGIAGWKDFFEENDTLYLVTEYIAGKSLGRIMKKRAGHPLQDTMAVNLLLPVLDTLEYVHQQNIIHRDVSPSNIMMTADGSCKLIDFGSSQKLSQIENGIQSTFLKIDFAAPEQYYSAKTGKIQEEGPWTDLYGIGASLCYMITGCMPRDCISRLQEENKDIFSKDPGESRLTHIVRKACSLEAKERYQSAAELKAELEEMV